MNKYDVSALRIRVEFTRRGRGSFERLSRRYALNAIAVQRELAEYIERHIDAGIDMTEEFTVRYEGGIFLTVYLCRGVFYISEVADVGSIIAAKAVMVWRRVKRGVEIVTAHMLTSWQLVRACG